jgi:cell division protein FtsZ
VTNQRTTPARFASEKEQASVSLPVAESRETFVEPRLIPVPASVFDDDFFRTSGHGVEIGPIDSIRMEERLAEPTHYSAAGHIEPEVEISIGETPARMAAYSGAVSLPVEHTEPDELDIPAFLRRGN